MNTNTQATDELMEKLKKILRLANDKGATQGEVEAAMAMAKRMAEKANVDLAMINFAADPTGSKLTFEVTKGETKIRSKKFQMYHSWIFNTLQDVFGVRVIQFRWNGNVAFVGATTDVLICQELLPWLEDVFCSVMTKHKNAARAQGLIPPGNGPAPASFLRGIYCGLWRGITEANRREQKKAPQQEQNALAVVLRRKEEVVQEALVKFFPNLKNLKSRATEMDADAFHHGLNEGRKVRLDQVGAAKSNAQLSQ